MPALPKQLATAPRRTKRRPCKPKSPRPILLLHDFFRFLVRHFGDFVFEPLQERLDLFFALVAIVRDRGDLSAALSYARELLVLTPNDPQVPALIRDLERRMRPG